jgi:polyisoprenoid-binding protein YceI
MSSRRTVAALFAFASLLATGAVQAAPVAYTIDPSHTYPSFEADHMGMSTWHGKFTRSSGTLRLDKATGSGDVDLKIDMDSIDFGLKQMNSVAREATLFDTAAHPYAFFKGRLEGFLPGGKAQVVGELTLRGVTKPLTLAVSRFNCKPHPLNKRDWCGADASATFQRDAFGIDAGKDWGFDMKTVLRIQVEAVAAE